MLSNHIGEIAALMTAVFWTVTALAFEIATKRVGPLSVNVIRLSMAFVFLAVFTFFQRGMALPIDASTHAWVWLSISGIVGFVLGDLFLFSSYPLITSRIAMLIMTLAPPLAALIGWIVLGETMTALNLFGMALVVLGISITILGRPDGGKKFSFNFSTKGLLFAFLGAVGQAIGLVLSKYGMGQYDPFAATQIRIIAALTGFIFIISFLKRWKKVIRTFLDKKAISRITLGSFFGPFLGVSFSLIALQHTSAGIAATLMAIVPVLIIAPSAIIFKQKITMKEVIGAVISVVGVSLFFI